MNLNSNRFIAEAFSLKNDVGYDVNVFVYFVDIAKCTCDLTANGCDPNCCCDPECEADDRNAFSECIDEYTSLVFCMMLSFNRIIDRVMEKL